MHGFEIAAIDPAGNVGTASRTVRVDPVAPAPVVPTQSGAATFTFASVEPDATFECRIEGLTEFAPCTSPVSFDLGPGDYVFALRTVDAAGNRSEPVTSAFSIAAPQPQPAATPAPQPIATPAPTPRPQAGETVVARAISGRILVKRPGGSGFVELRGTDGIPVGSEVNAKNGRVRLTIEPGDGKPLQQAVFYAGIFKLSQAGDDARPDAQRAARGVQEEGREGGAEQGEVAQAVGRRQGQVPHAGPLQRGDGPRHDLARAGLLRRDADAGPPGRRLGARPQADGARPRRAQLPRQSAPLTVWRLPGTPESG